MTTSDTKAEINSDLPQTAITSGFDFGQLDEITACSHAEELVFIDPKTKEETDFIIMVLGAHAESVKKDTYKSIDREKRRNYKAERSGKTAEPKPVSETMDEGISGIAKRIVGWRGLVDVQNGGAIIEYSTQMALQLCTKSPSLREQVQEFSEELGNFGNGK